MQYPCTLRFYASLFLSDLAARCLRQAAARGGRRQGRARREAAAAEDAAREAADVKLEPEEVAKLGIAAAAADAVRYVPAKQGFAVVLSHDAIAQAVADVATAQAGARQSQAVLARMARLAGTAGAESAEAHESAVRQAAVDSAALHLAEAKSSAIVGQHPPWAGQDDSKVLADLAAGRSKMLRVTFPLGALNGAAPSSLRIARLDAGADGRKMDGARRVGRAGRPRRSRTQFLRAAAAHRCGRRRAAAGVGKRRWFRRHRVRRARATRGRGDERRQVLVLCRAASRRVHARAARYQPADGRRLLRRRASSPASGSSLRRRACCWRAKPIPARKRSRHARAGIAVRAPLRRGHGADGAGADARLLGRDAMRRWMCFRNSFPRRSISRPRRPDSRRSRWRNWSPSRSRMPSTARRVWRRCAPSRFPGCRWSPSPSPTTSMCTSPARAFPSGCRNSAAACPPASGRRSSRRWCRAPWTCSRSDCCPTRSMPMRCAMPPIGSSSRACWPCPAWRTSSCSAATCARSRSSPTRNKLASFGITLTEVADAARAALPLRGAGFIDLAAQRVLMQIADTDAGSRPPSVKAVVAVRNGAAGAGARRRRRSKMAPALRSGDALIMGKPGVLLSLASQYGANTLTATLAVEKALAILRPRSKAQGITRLSRAASSGEFHRARAWAISSTRC